MIGPDRTGTGDKDGFMGEVREGLGEMASPVDLGQALAAIGLFRAAPGDADLAGELERLGSTELLRLEMANWLLGAASMQVLMATGAADDAGVDPVAINRASARMLSGADCEHDDELKTAFARLLARQLESLLMVLTAEQLASKGHSELPLLIQPSMAVAGYLLALLEAGSANQSGTAGDYPGQVRRAAEGLRGIAEVLENMVGRAS